MRLETFVHARQGLGWGEPDADSELLACFLPLRHCNLLHSDVLPLHMLLEFLSRFANVDSLKPLLQNERIPSSPLGSGASP
jgi:hypothetical protein